MITKSGTNELHGRLFWMNTTASLNARPYFSPSKGAEHHQRFRRFRWRPIRRNKTFIYGGFEGLRQSQSTIVTPSLSDRHEDASRRLLRVARAIARDCRSRSDNKPAFPGNIIPAVDVQFGFG